MAFLFDSKSKNIVETVNVEESTTTNYDGIITIIDGETESNFTNTWGNLIADGYPICSSLVIDNVGKDGHMNWQTVEALNDIGVEFIFHSCDHVSYNNRTIDDVKKDLERGTKTMEEHNIDHKIILWLDQTKEELCELGYDYFDGGIVSKSDSKAIYGEKNNRMMNEHVIGWYPDRNCSLAELVQFIEIARKNNGWAIIFTRNPYIDSTQIDIYRKAFQYAEEHNVGIVSASEGFDLFYGNKLGR